MKQGKTLNCLWSLQHLLPLCNHLSHQAPPSAWGSILHGLSAFCFLMTQSFQFAVKLVWINIIFPEACKTTNSLVLPLMDHPASNAVKQTQSKNFTQQQFLQWKMEARTLSLTQNKQFVAQWLCPSNDIPHDDKYSTHYIGNPWWLAWWSPYQTLAHMWVQYKVSTLKERAHKKTLE